MPRVLISDKMSPKAAEVFKARGIDVDVQTGLSKDELIAIIGDYDGLAVRSSTRPDAEIIAAAKNLKVIGRAGIGTDNIDKQAATERGIVVMNTPFGNAITTAEHAMQRRDRSRRPQRARKMANGPSLIIRAWSFSIRRWALSVAGILAHWSRNVRWA